MERAYTLPYFVLKISALHRYNRITRKNREGTTFRNYQNCCNKGRVRRYLSPVTYRSHFRNVFSNFEKWPFSSIDLSISLYIWHIKLRGRMMRFSKAIKNSKNRQRAKGAVTMTMRTLRTFRIITYRSINIADPLELYCSSIALDRSLWINRIATPRREPSNDW